MSGRNRGTERGGEPGSSSQTSSAGKHARRAGGRRQQLTVLEPPPRAWPGGRMVPEPSLAAGRDAAGGQCLWAGRPQAPGGRVPPQVDWLAGFAPQSCFRERPRGRSAPRGPCRHRGKEADGQRPALACPRAHERREWHTRPPGRSSRIPSDPRPGLLGPRGLVTRQTPRHTGPAQPRREDTPPLAKAGLGPGLRSRRALTPRPTPQRWAAPGFPAPHQPLCLGRSQSIFSSPGQMWARRWPGAAAPGTPAQNTSSCSQTPGATVLYLPCLPPSPWAPLSGVLCPPPRTRTRPAVAWARGSL